MSSRLDRREFLAAIGGAPFVWPNWSSTLLGTSRNESSRALVLVELLGGNDGLNTLVPLDDDDYRRARPSLGVPASDVLRLTDDYGLHPALLGLRELFDRGEAAAVHGVGYPAPDRSHFRSRDIWQVADPTLQRVEHHTTGWLGRIADHFVRTEQSVVPALGVGGVEVPLALHGANGVAPILWRLEDYELSLTRDVGPARAAVERSALARLLSDGSGAPADSLAARSELHEFVREVSTAGVAQAARLQQALAAYRPRVDFPDHEFGAAMRLAARVLVSGFGTRVCHVPLAGFDTHARQAPTHAGLLARLGDGLAALVGELRAHAMLDRVTIVVHSEFGRRVAENRSQGTDHGAAAPMFVCGGGVSAGLHGETPSLVDLDDGDLIATTDFRWVFESVAQWLGVPAGLAVPAGGVPRIGAAIPLWSV